MRHRLSLLSAGTALAIFVAAPASASLIGDTVGAAITGGSLVLSPATAQVVDPGVEFGGVFGTTTEPAISLDFAASSATFSWLRGPFGFATDILTFTDLDFSGPSSVLVGVTVLADGSGLNDSDITFTADSVTVDLRGWILTGPGQAVFTFITRDPSPPTGIPEPASLALLGAGLVGLGGLRRRGKVGIGR